MTESESTFQGRRVVTLTPDASRGTYKRQHALHDREHQRKNQRKVTDFSNHGAISLKVEKTSLIC